MDNFYSFILMIHETYIIQYKNYPKIKSTFLIHTPFRRGHTLTRTAYSTLIFPNLSHTDAVQPAAPSSSLPPRCRRDRVRTLPIPLWPLLQRGPPLLCLPAAALANPPPCSHRCCDDHPSHAAMPLCRRRWRRRLCLHRIDGWPGTPCASWRALQHLPPCPVGHDAESS